jgi:hypothetical protein
MCGFTRPPVIAAAANMNLFQYGQQRPHIHSHVNFQHLLQLRYLCQTFNFAPILMSQGQ